MYSSLFWFYYFSKLNLLMTIIFKNFDINNFIWLLRLVVNSWFNMRTYSRKNVKHDAIEGIMDLCRLCLCKTEEEVVIFNNKHDIYSALSLRIMICVGLEITNEDILPNKICSKCHEELEKFYKFKRKCEFSYIKLKAHKRANNNVKSEPQNLLFIEDQLIPYEDPKHSSKESNNIEESIKICDSTVLHSDEVSLADNLQIINHTIDQESIILETSENNSTVSIEGVIIENNSTETGLIQEEEISSLKQKIVNNEETTEVAIPVHTENYNPDIVTFLNCVLSNFGVMKTKKNKFTMPAEQVSFLLESGDDQQYTIELVEEDDNQMEDEPSENIRKKTVVSPNQDKPHRKNSEAGAGGGGGGGWWCRQCGKALSSRGALARHGGVHSGARPHACPRCPRAFSQRFLLKRHLLVHLAERPFKCGSCSKSFTQRGALATHARSHAPPPARPLALHPCALCDKHFLYPSGLSRHMLEHRGRVFPCAACRKHFKDGSSLQRHYRTYHADSHTQL